MGLSDLLQNEILAFVHNNNRQSGKPLRAPDTVDPNYFRRPVIGLSIF